VIGKAGPSREKQSTAVVAQSKSMGSDSALAEVETRQRQNSNARESEEKESHPTGINTASSIVSLVWRPHMSRITP